MICMDVQKLRLAEKKMRWTQGALQNTRKSSIGGRIPTQN
jgi:hypothetical protein